MGLITIFIVFTAIIILGSLVFGLALGYLMRKAEIGPASARREVKLTLATIPLIIAFLLGIFFLFPTFRNNPSLIYAGLLAFLILFPTSWLLRTQKARKAVLYQVPVRQSVAYLLAAIFFPFLGAFNLIAFDFSEWILGLTYILLAMIHAVTWFRPSWLLTHDGIVWYWQFLKWEQITAYKWHPLNKEEALLKIERSHWLPLARLINQPVPLAHQQPFEAFLQSNMSRDKQKVAGL